MIGKERMLRQLFPGLMGVLVVMALAACQPAPTATPGPMAKPTETRAPTRWDSALEAAKREGKVSVYALWGQESRVAVSQAFRKKFGIEAEFTSFNRGAEMLARVRLEKNAGLNIPDVFGAGGPTLLTVMMPAGVLGNIKPLLFLPEVTDGKAWKGGKLPFSDKTGTTIAQLATANRFLVYNTDLIKQGELTSYEDVLKPQYRGKITLNDPTVTGSGNATFSHLAMHIFGNVDKARDYLRRLVKDQRAEIIRDNRLQLESVARGKHSIGVGGRIATQAEFIDAGAPIAQVKMDKVFISHADSVLGVPLESPHPNATLIFINWLLSAEGHAVYVSSTGNPGLRVDAPTGGINAIFFPDPKEELFLDTEDFITFRGKMQAVAREVIAGAEGQR